MTTDVQDTIMEIMINVTNLVIGHGRNFENEKQLEIDSLENLIVETKLNHSQLETLSDVENETAKQIATVVINKFVNSSISCVDAYISPYNMENLSKEVIYALTEIERFIDN